MFLLAPFAQAVSALLMVCGLASGAATGDLAVLALSLCGVGLYALCGMALAAVLALSACGGGNKDDSSGGG